MGRTQTYYYYVVIYNPMNRLIILNVNIYNKGSMTSFEKVDNVTFELPCAFTWGVKKDKNTGYYNIPVVPDEETITKVSELTEENGAKSPLYGSYNTLYLRLGRLTPKQTKDLLNKGRSHVLINFILEGVRTSGDTKYLSFRVTKLRKVECDTDSDVYAED